MSASGSNYWRVVKFHAHNVPTREWANFNRVPLLIRILQRNSC
jgi:hypothetical protein